MIRADLSPHSPWRATDWRWQRALLIAAGSMRLNSRFDDAFTTRAVRVARAMHDSGDTALDAFASSDPALYWAHKLRWEAPAGTRAETEARILADDTPDEIERRVGVLPGTLATFEKLYFDVRCRLKMKAYVLHAVMGEELQRGLSERNYALLWKFYGFIYGPRMLDSLIDQAIAPYQPRTEDEVRYAWQDDGIGSVLRKQAIAARTMPVNTFTQLDILAVYSKFVEIERASGRDRAAQQPNSMLASVDAMLKALPMDVGQYATVRVDSATLAHYDSGASELNCQQLLLAAKDIQPNDAADLENLTYPEVTNHHATTQQGSGAPDLASAG